MFVYNISLNKTTMVKVFFVIVAILLVLLFCNLTYKIFMKSIDTREMVNDAVPNPDTIELTSQNYTNFLKTIHDNKENYFGKKIKLSGYVYKLPDFKENEFVIARDMVISSDLQTLVVGFLCTSNEAKDYPPNTWIEITGKIVKGNFYEEIPIIETETITKTEKPKDAFVYPPDDNFIPTINLF